ncbi:hypothetical protein T09_10552 [Trichinella sp. T9]|nr:hypothetical protein T09_10552 [Trichinella sp. T9]
MEHIEYYLTRRSCKVSRMRKNQFKRMCTEMDAMDPSNECFSLENTVELSLSQQIFGGPSDNPVILNQTQNSRHSIYYATLFAIYWLQLHAALIYLVDYILQRLIQKAPGLQYASV